MGNAISNNGKAEISALGSEPIVAGQPPPAGQPDTGSVSKDNIQPTTGSEPVSTNALCIVLFLLTQCWKSCCSFHATFKKYPRATHGCLLCGFLSGMYDANNLKDCYDCYTYVNEKDRGEYMINNPEVEIFYPTNPCTYLCMFYNLLHEDGGVDGDNLCCFDCIGNIIMTSGCAPFFVPCATINCGCNILYCIFCCDINEPQINVFGKFCFC
jgi:hypothetical protein